MIVEENSTLPVPVPESITTSAPSVTGELISIKPLLVLMLLEIVRAVELRTRDESSVVPPIIPPRTTLPEPDVKVKAWAPSIVEEKSTFPPPDPDVIVMSPPRVTGALISIKPVSYTHLTLPTT